MKWEAHCPEDGTAHGKRVPVPSFCTSFFLFRPLNPIPSLGSDTLFISKIHCLIIKSQSRTCAFDLEAWMFIRARLLAAQGLKTVEPLSLLWIDTIFGCGLSSLRRALSTEAKARFLLWETGAWILSSKFPSKLDWEASGPCSDGYFPKRCVARHTAERSYWNLFTGETPGSRQTKKHPSIHA